MEPACLCPKECTEEAVNASAPAKLLKLAKKLKSFKKKVQSAQVTIQKVTDFSETDTEKNSVQEMPVL